MKVDMQAAKEHFLCSCRVHWLLALAHVFVLTLPNLMTYTAAPADTRCSTAQR